METYDRKVRALNDVICSLDECYLNNCEGCDYCGNGCKEVLMEDARFWLKELRHETQRLRCGRDMALAERDALREKLPLESKKKSVWRRIKEKENGND